MISTFLALFLTTFMLNEVTTLSMGFGKTMHLPYNRQLRQSRAFDFNIFPESGHHFEDPYIQLQLDVLSEKVSQRHHPLSSHQHKPKNFLEIDLKFAKKKPIAGVRHLFCSGYYCAFEYAS